MLQKLKERVRQAYQSMLQGGEESYRKLSIFLYALVGAFLLVMAAGDILHPKSALDSWLSKMVCEAWQSTGSLKVTLYRVLIQIKHLYETWEGCFSAVLIYNFHPGLFSEKLYFLSNLIIILSYLAGIGLTLSYGLRRVYKLGAWQARSLIAWVQLFLLINLWDQKVIFDWYGNGVYYTLFFAFSLFWLNLALRLPKIKNKPLQVLSRLFLIALSFVIGGGTLDNAFIGLCLILLSAFILHRQKTPERLMLLFSLAALAMAVYINLRAPGYAVQTKWLAEINKPALSLGAAIWSSMVSNLVYLLDLGYGLIPFAIGAVLMLSRMDFGAFSIHKKLLFAFFTAMMLLQNVIGLASGFASANASANAAISAAWIMMALSYLIQRFKSEFKFECHKRVCAFDLSNPENLDREIQNSDKNGLAKFTAGNLRPYAYALWALFLVSLVPMIWAAFYNYPAMDDISYGARVRNAWAESGSLIASIKAALDNVVYSYNQWQGTFTAIFLFSLHPGVFSEKLYWISTLILLGMFLLGNAVLLRVLLKHYFKAEPLHRFMLILLFLLYSVQNNPNPGSTFYWYNGAVYYTFFYSLALLLFGLLLLLPKIQRKGGRIALKLLLPPLFLLLGGGNYMSTLFSCMVLALICLYFFLRKEKTAKTALVSLAFLALGFGISIIAPGNGIRSIAVAANGYHSISPLKAVLLSLIQGCDLINQNLNTMRFFILILLCAPFIWRIVSQSDFSFRYPLGVLFISYACYCTLFTPMIYVNIPFEARYSSLFYSAFLLLAMINVFYILGWISKRYEVSISRKSPEPIPVQSGIQKHRGVWNGLILLTACMILAMGTVGQKATEALLSGQAQRYAAQQEERLRVMTDPSIEDVVLKPIKDVPVIFEYKEVTADKDEWFNRSMADYYKKKSVIVGK